jgi:hypothetical protein
MRSLGLIDILHRSDAKVTATQHPRGRESRRASRHAAIPVQSCGLFNGSRNAIEREMSSNQVLIVPRPLNGLTLE